MTKRPAAFLQQALVIRYSLFVICYSLFQKRPAPVQNPGSSLNTRHVSDGEPPQ